MHVRAAVSMMVVAALAMAPLALFSSTAVAAVGEPDPSFGSGGFTLLDEPVGNNEFLTDVLVLPDGKILGAGARGGQGVAGFLLARFNSDGTPDIAFGEEGIRVEPDLGMPGSPVQITDIERRSDGRIVAGGVGRGPKGVGAFELARYRPDGTLDPEFGSGGLATVPVEPAGEALAIAQAPGGKLVAVGNDGPGEKAVVVRVKENGAPDDEFNDVPAGVRPLDVPGSMFEEAYAVSVEESGAILIGGYGSSGAFLAELDANGNPVGDFGENGFAVHDLGSRPEPSGYIEDLAVLSDGRILATGGSEAGPNDQQAFVARFTPGGELDPSFGTAGVLHLNPTPGDDEAFSLEVLPGGRILVAGIRGETGPNTGDTWLVRLTPEGRLDPSFGSGGEVTASAAAGNDLAAGLALQPDGRAVIAGSAFDGSRKLLVGRFTADPPPATTEARTARCEGRRATLLGTSGPDRLVGTRRADVIVALGGNDRVKAAAGNDVVCGGAGRDLIRGGGGRDTAAGGPGADVLFGAAGPDLLLGGAGRDLLLGGPGRPDRCNGGPGRRDHGASSCERLRRVP